MQHCYINYVNFFFRSVSLEHQGVQSFHARYFKNNLRSMQTRTKFAPVFITHKQSIIL